MVVGGTSTIPFAEEELGNKVNVDKSTISSYERDRTFPDQHTLGLLIEVLDLPTEYVVEREEKKNSKMEAVFANSCLYEINMIIKKRERKDQELLLQFLKGFL